VPPLALLLVVGAAVCHSAWTLIFKSEPRRLQAFLGALIVATALCAPVVLVHSPAQLTPGTWALVLLSAAFETAYVVALTAAYEIGDLSLVYPIARGTAPLLVVPLAVLLLGERPSALGLLGIALVVVGIFAVHRPIHHRGAASARVAVALAMVTGVMTAGYSVVNKVGVQRAPVPLYAFLVFAVDAVLLAAVLALRGHDLWPRGGSGWGRAAAVGALMLAAYLGVLDAMSLAPVSYVVAGREVSIVITALAGAIMLREPHSTRRLAAAAVIFVGLVVLSVSR
jgi:drug/metabolite transporter (DMT)-like permease